MTTTAPENKVKTKEVVGDIPTTGKNQKVKVKVTYADDSFDEVEVTLNYGTAAEKYTPVGQGVTVEKGGTLEASDGIKNKTELPTGTTYKWKEKVNTTDPGTKKGTIVVTYPDQTTDEVEVDVQVKETKTDAQTYEAVSYTHLHSVNCTEDIYILAEQQTITRHAQSSFNLYRHTEYDTMIPKKKYKNG